VKESAMRAWMMGLAAVVAMAAGPAWAAEWVWLKAPAEKFTLELPGAAVKSSEPMATDVGEVAVITYLVERPEGVYDASVIDFEVALPEADALASLNDAIDGYLDEVGGAQAWRRTVRVSGAAAVEAEFTVSRDGVSMRGRLLYAFKGGRLYSVTAVEASGVPAGAADRMVASLTLLD